MALGYNVEYRRLAVTRVALIYTYNPTLWTSD